MTLKLTCEIFLWRQKNQTNQLVRGLLVVNYWSLIYTFLFFFSSEDEEFVSSFITSRSEKQLVQQLKRSLLSTKNYSDIAVNSVKKVKLLKYKKY